MPVHNEKRVLWHPRYSNKFVVGGGSQITLYELSDEQPEIRHITSQHDLQFMKCFAWSPANIPSDIFAVGHNSGRVDLLRLEASRYSSSTDNVLSSGPIQSLPVKNQRSCNALAFCPSDPYLAVGYDKIRGDGSLVIWDVVDDMRVFRAAVSSNDESTLSVPYSTTSIASFNTHPPIPRTDFPVRADQRIVQAHAQTELISSIAWLPQTSHPFLLLAGIYPRWLRLFDLRTPAGSGSGTSYVSSVASKVSGIATDPFDATRFATWGDGTITLWDIRKLHTTGMHPDSPSSTPSPTPLLTITEKDAGMDGESLPHGSSTSSFAKSRNSVSTSNLTSSSALQQAYVTVEFSPTRRGMLASLSKDASYVRMWDVLDTGDSPFRREIENVDESVVKLKTPISKKPWVPWGGVSDSTVQPLPREEPIIQRNRPAMLLYNTRKAFSNNPSSHLCSFGIIPPIFPSHRTKSKVVVVTQTGDIAVQSVYDAPQALVWSSRGELLYGPFESLDKENNKAEFGILSGKHEDDEEHHEIPRKAFDNQGAMSIGDSKYHIDPESQGITERGRARNLVKNALPSPALFGRGDAEGFPALSRTSNATPANIAATKPIDGGHEANERKRTFSPAASLRVPIRPTNGLPSTSTVTIKSRDKPLTSVKAQNLTDRQTNVDSRNIHPHIAQALADDISMIMQKRALKGYGIHDPLKNASIIRELCAVESEKMGRFLSSDTKMLADLWEWIHHSQNFLSSPTPLLHGYDFSFAGLWGIWDGPRSIGGSGIIPRYMDPDPHAATFLTDSFNHSSGSTSGSVSSSLDTGSIRTSPGSSLNLGIFSENVADADATPVHRDRLDLPSVLETPLHHTVTPLDRSRRQGPNSIHGSRRPKSPLPDPLTKDPEWRQALLNLFARSLGPDSSTHLPKFPYITTSRPLQRHICLHLIGWGFVLRDESLMGEVRRWERENDGDDGYARAAAWLVFSGRYGGGVGVSNEGTVYGEGAIECLLRSDDETHHMMSGVIAALAPFASTTFTSANSSSKLTLPSTLREHYERLINKLNDPYLRALLTHLTAISSSDALSSGEHWLEILHDEADLLPFYERLAMAICFLDDAALTTYLRRCREHALSKSGGDVDALVVTGLGTLEGAEILSLWLDRHSDVQSAALLGWLGVCVSFGQHTTGFRAEDKSSTIDSRVTRWVEAYRDYLDSIKLFHCRVEFDIERGQTLQRALERRNSETIPTLAPKQILIRCNYCNTIVAPNSQASDANSPGLRLNSSSKGKPTACPKCGRALPRCSICLMTLGIVQDALREIELAHSHYQDTIDDAIVICQNCRHGGHASHILEWFFGGEHDGQTAVSHKVCAVADCNCQCAYE